MTDSLAFGLSTDDLEKIKSVFSTHPAVIVVKIYGSRATGSFKPHSDIDMTLFGENLDTTLLFRIETELDDLLLPYKIDLSLFEYIENEQLVKHIQEEGQVLYSNSKKAINDH